MRTLLYVFIISAFVSRASLAGPNAGGTLILHASPLAYSQGETEYCGQSGLETCSSAVDSVGLTGTRVIFVLAAFPSGSSPRLQGVTFGLSYDESGIAIPAYGSCGDFELPTTSWPAPETGTSVAWTALQTDHLTEVYWLAAYSYVTTPTSLDLRDCPGQGGYFGDDSVPAQLDSIATFGTMGFGRRGYLPCPDAGQGDGLIKAIYRE